jgi:multidrug resistance efflux pump
MKSDPLPKIPTPAAHQWRQFRITVIPALTFLLVLGLTVWLWGLNLASPVLMGTAEGQEAEVSSPRDGRLAQLHVKQYQEVTAGQPLAIIEAVDPAILSNNLAVIHAEMDLIRAEAGYDAGDRVRYSQFQLDFMLRRVELTLERLALPYSQLNLTRHESMYRDGITSLTNYEGAQLALAQLQAQVKESEEALTVAQKDLKKLDPAAMNEDSPTVRAQLAVEEQKLLLAEAEYRPIVLTAPISGRVSKIAMLPGMSVAANVPIVTIADPKVDRILGFIGQPLRLEPKIGATVEIRSRNAKRTMGKSHITQIGPRIELFNAPLRLRGMGAAQERGLPILMDVPAGMELRPGELVDIFFVKENPAL